jgi:hypothetical protein
VIPQECGSNIRLEAIPGSRLKSLRQAFCHKMKKTIIAIAILAAALIFPLAVGVWLPDVLYAKHHTIAEIVASDGNSFRVIQYWNRGDFYNTELLHLTPEGRTSRHVLDGDDSKSWSVPITVDVIKKNVYVRLSGNRTKTVKYGEAEQYAAPLPSEGAPSEGR